jgi:hypothetical protein
MPDVNLTVVNWVQRVRGEYLDMPGLVLTQAQMQRLFGIGAGECESVIDELVKTGFLYRTNRKMYVMAGSAGASA